VWWEVWHEPRPTVTNILKSVDISQNKCRVARFYGSRCLKWRNMQIADGLKDAWTMNGQKVEHDLVWYTGGGRNSLNPVYRKHSTTKCAPPCCAIKITKRGGLQWSPALLQEHCSQCTPRRFMKSLEMCFIFSKKLSKLGISGQRIWPQAQTVHSLASSRLVSQCPNTLRSNTVDWC